MSITKSNRQIRGLGLLLIFISAFVSFLLATTINIEHHELGALINYLWPPMIGLVTFMLFLIMSFIIRNAILLKVILAILCVYNLYVGFAFHIEKEYWPLVSF